MNMIGQIKHGARSIIKPVILLTTVITKYILQIIQVSANEYYTPMNVINWFVDISIQRTQKRTIITASQPRGRK